jgi:hypothetical protein
MSNSSNNFIEFHTEMIDGFMSFNGDHIHVFAKQSISGYIYEQSIYFDNFIFDDKIIKFNLKQIFKFLSQKINERDGVNHISYYIEIHDDKIKLNFNAHIYVCRMTRYICPKFSFFVAKRMN